MAQRKVVIAERLFPDTDIEQKILDTTGGEISVGTCRTEDEVIELASDAEALVTFAFKPVSDKIMSSCKKLKIIVRGGIGVDTVDIPAASRNGIIITNLPGYCAKEVSDLTISMMLTLLYKLPIAMKHSSRGEWNRDAIKPLRSLWKLTVGIIGFGNIGRGSAKRAASFGMKVQFYDPNVKENVSIDGAFAQKVELDVLLRSSDAILLHAPATEKTHHIINRENLKKVKRGCILVNTARGQLVDTEALVEALEDGVIGGAGLDLIENVPPLAADHPLLRFDNVIITPYMAWYTEDSVVTLRETIASEIARVFKGYYPRAIVNPEVKPTARAGHLKEEPR